MCIYAQVICLSNFSNLLLVSAHKKQKVFLDRVYLVNVLFILLMNSFAKYGC